jgi:S-adenosylmethionine:tRNA ribosyltransferase-isomerase
VLDRCRQRGIGIATVDLAVGLDTFRPIDVDDADDHVMHSERYRFLSFGDAMLVERATQ